ncbi:MAG: peptidylprolyl isomerase [Deltaproteobacteria bacterium]|nr:peptidylprolyl isomerase [Deltaproteobacteria bacterium]
MLPASCGSSPPARHSGRSELTEAQSVGGQKNQEPLPPEHEVTDRVRITTSMGSVIVGLYGKDAPRTAQNFLKYVDRGFYAGKVFHRVIAGFMVQGGGFDAELNRIETDDPIKLEIIPGLKHEPGILSMARTSDPHSATSQFFICIGIATQLNGGYAAFGRVEEGMDTVAKISQVPIGTVETNNGSMADVPSDPVIIESVDRL